MPCASELVLLFVRPMVVAFPPLLEATTSVRTPADSDVVECVCVRIRPRGRTGAEVCAPGRAVRCKRVRFAQPPRLGPSRWNAAPRGVRTRAHRPAALARARVACGARASSASACASTTGCDPGRAGGTGTAAECECARIAPGAGLQPSGRLASIVECKCVRIAAGEIGTERPSEVGTTANPACRPRARSPAPPRLRATRTEPRIQSPATWLRRAHPRPRRW